MTSHGPQAPPRRPADKSVSDHIADLTGGRPALRRFGPLWWTVSLIGLLLALGLAALSGLIVPAGCDASEGLLEDLGTYPEALGLCDARSGWRRALLTGLALGAAAALALALMIVAGGIARAGGEGRRGRLSFSIRSGFWAAVAPRRACRRLAARCHLARGASRDRAARGLQRRLIRSSRALRSRAARPGSRLCRPRAGGSRRWR